MNSERM